MKETFVIESEPDVNLLREAVTWFLRTQDPDLDDAIYDANDRIIVRDILLPRMTHPLDVNAGTCKDLGLLTQSLETALKAGAIESETAPALLCRLKDYAAREKARLSKST